MRYYNSISMGYNQLHGEAQARKAGLIKANCPLHGLLLDIGAGTGTTTALFPCKECIALDPAKEMLEQFLGLKVVARAEQLPFKENSFDRSYLFSHAKSTFLGKSFSDPLAARFSQYSSHLQGALQARHIRRPADGQVCDGL